MSSYVGLNVGGKIYRTSRTTLTREPDSFFPLLLSGQVPSQKDEEGNCLIDCDGKIFRHVLNYMRYGKLVLPDGFSEYELLRCQADFFRLECLQLQIQPGKMKTSEDIGNYVGLNVGGNIYYLTKEHISREPDCAFASLVRDNCDHFPADKLGNFIIDKGMYQGEYWRTFIRVLHYLNSGDVYTLLSSVKSKQDGECLEMFIKKLGLEGLDEHLDGIAKISETERIDGRSVILKVITYCYPSGDNDIYISPGSAQRYKSCFPLSKSDSRDAVYTRSSDSVIAVRFKLVESNSEGFRYGDPTSQEQLIAYISRRTHAHKTRSTELSGGCTKTEFLMLGKY